MPLTKVVVGFLGFVVLGACVQSSEPSGDVGAGPAPASATEIRAADNRFEPDVLTGRAGEELVVEIRNDGSASHEFAIDDLGLTTGTIKPGETAHARFAVPEGTTVFECTYHGGMEGRIEGT